MLRLSDIMTTDVVTVSPELGLRDAMDLFVARHISGAPVVEGQRVIGVVSITDLMALAAALPGVPTVRETPVEPAATEEAEVGEEIEDGGEPPAAFFTDLWDDVGPDVAERTDTPATPEWNVLEEHTVGEAMNAAVCAQPPETDVPRAAEFMQQRGIHRVLVMAEDRLLGIVTTTDIARAVAEHQLSERRFVFGQPQVRADGSWW